MHQLTKKDTPWNWNKKAQEAFDNLKTILSNDMVLANYDPSQQIGISCDASACGIRAVLFHRYQDGSERNASKSLTDAQRNYSQIQKEALAIVFSLKNFISSCMEEDSYLSQTINRCWRFLVQQNRLQLLQQPDWGDGLSHSVNMTTQ